MIAPKKSPSRSVGQHPFTHPPDTCFPCESETTSQDGTIAATEHVDNAADVNGTLDAFSISQFRQFFELLDGWDTQRATADGETGDLGGEILVGINAASKNLGSTDGDIPEAVPASPATPFRPEPKELRPALPASEPADDTDAPRKVIQLDGTLPVTVPTIVEDKKVAA